MTRRLLIWGAGIVAFALVLVVGRYSGKDKEGVVMAVIAGGRDSGERANAEIKARTQAGTHRSAFGGGWARDHESYVVEVRQGGPKSKPVLYWPVASKLRKDDGNVEASDS